MILVSHGGSYDRDGVDSSKTHLLPEQLFRHLFRLRALELGARSPQGFIVSLGQQDVGEAWSFPAFPVLE